MPDPTDDAKRPVRPPCPHKGDPSHGGLGKPWCDDGRDGALYLALRAARIRATREAAPDA